MSFVTEQFKSSTVTGGGNVAEIGAMVAHQLQDYFDAPFVVWDAKGGVIDCPAGVCCEDLPWSALVKVVAEKREAEFLAEAGGVAILAVPVVIDDNTNWVGTAAFVIGPVSDRDRGEAQRLTGLAKDPFQKWLAGQASWGATALLKLAKAARDKLLADGNVRRMSKEVELISGNLASTYEEISLLYAVTKNLKISSTDEDLGRLAIEWLGECVPATAFAVMYLPPDGRADASYEARSRTRYITSGECPVDESEFLRLIESLQFDAAAGPHVLNDRVTANTSWGFPDVRQLIAVPLCDGENVFGYLAVFNHSDGGEFGTVEANLIGSLGTLLGIHCGNRTLYRQQSELLADMVRALVSAIDAKDPYTSGHSDRVARFAVRIALELRCPPKFVNTIYMAGLLHDVGKIGIDDNVLRKTGRLTEQEFDHIKKHPELGHRILADLRPLADVLPAVLHHHEQWDGRGYPAGLSTTDIPLIARILAVADAYDAMTSDRPYRAGMPEEKVYKIFREGAGQHWDPEVLDAFFRAKDDINDIRAQERIPIDSFRQQLV